MSRQKQVAAKYRAMTPEQAIEKMKDDYPVVVVLPWATNAPRPEETKDLFGVEFARIPHGRGNDVEYRFLNEDDRAQFLMKLAYWQKDNGAIRQGHAQ